MSNAEAELAHLPQLTEDNIRIAIVCASEPESVKLRTRGGTAVQQTDTAIRKQLYNGSSYNQILSLDKGLAWKIRYQDESCKLGKNMTGWCLSNQDTYYVYTDKAKEISRSAGKIPVDKANLPASFSTAAAIELLSGSQDHPCQLEPNQDYLFQGLFANHRCDAAVAINIYDKSNNIISQEIALLDSSKKGGVKQKDYCNIQTSIPASHEIRFARIYLLKGITNSSSNSYLFIAQPSFYGNNKESYCLTTQTPVKEKLANKKFQHIVLFDIDYAAFNEHHSGLEEVIVFHGPDLIGRYELDPRRFLLDVDFYNRLTNLHFGSTEDAYAHYVDTPADARKPVNPVDTPQLERQLKEILPILKRNERACCHIVNNFGAIIDFEHFYDSYGLRGLEAIKFILNKIEKNVWVSFNPLITYEDFKASSFSDLAEWIRFLSDPNQSLMDENLIFFSAKYYRSTCKKLFLNNELLDFIIFRNITYGLPHVFIDYWYYHQFSGNPIDERLKIDLWVGFIKRPYDYEYLTPFFDSKYFNHEYVHSGQADRGHPLKNFLLQNTPMIAPHRETIPNALLHSFGNIALLDQIDTEVTPKQFIDLLESALTQEVPRVSGSAEVSIIILNYNKPVHTILSSIAAAQSRGRQVEVLVLDNGSHPKDFAIISKYLEIKKNVKVFRSRTNLYFGEGNNVALDCCSAEYILFLNNDAYLQNFTIDKLIEFMNLNENAAACGPTFIFPNHKIQEAGGYIADDGQQIQFRKHAEIRGYINQLANEESLSVSYISSACFLVRKSILDKIGGYDLAFEPLYYEDTDLCRRIVSTGHEIVCLKQNFVMHVENASTKDFFGSKFHSHIENSRNIYRNRWLYQQNHYNPRAYFDIFRNIRKTRRPIALVYTPYGINIGGGERYILSLVMALCTDYHVVVAGPNPISTTRVSFTLQDLSIHVPHGCEISVMTLNEYMSFGLKPSLMVAMGNEIFPPIATFGDVNIFHCQFPFPHHHSDNCYADRLSNVDVFFVNSDFTRSSVEQQLSINKVSVPVFTTFAPVSLQPSKKLSSAPANKLKIVSVGRFDPKGHAKRQDVIIDIFMSSKILMENSQLYLVGGCDTVDYRVEYLNDLKNKAHPSIEFHVNASREKLEEIYGGAQAYIHACGYGFTRRDSPEKLEHFGITVVEAMSRGLIPVVYAEGGPAEIVSEAEVGYIYQSKDEARAQLEAIIALSSSEVDRCSSLASESARKYSDDAFRQSVRKYVDEAIASQRNK